VPKLADAAGRRAPAVAACPSVESGRAAGGQLFGGTLKQGARRQQLHNLLVLPVSRAGDSCTDRSRHSEASNPFTAVDPRLPSDRAPHSEPLVVVEVV
jgi:hypothetical protein